MIALPLELEQQVIQFANIEHIDPVAFLKNVIADYVQRAIQTENTAYLAAVSDTLADEWNGAEDEVNFRDL